MNNKKETLSYIKGVLMGVTVTVTCFVVLVTVGLYTGRLDLNSAIKTGSSQVTDEQAEKIKDKVNLLSAYIDKYYLNNIDYEKMADSIYKGILNGLDDKYAAYYTKDEYDALKEETSGSYCGIGALVSQNADTGVITAINVFKGSPAEKAGMKNGDIIFKVEDKEVTGEDLNNVVAKMKGEKDTKVKINVYRTSEKEYIDLEITRDKVDVPTVEHKMLDKSKGIGYIQITQFEEVTYDQFKEALDDLKKQGMKSVIFDLRNNPGGLYDTVCEMLDDLLPEGTLVYTKDKDGC